MKPNRLIAALLLLCLTLSLIITPAAVADDPACPHEVTANRVEVISYGTCTTPGSYWVITYCAGCGTELSREMDETPPSGSHVPGGPVTENYTPSSCLYDGWYDQVVYCSQCGAELSRERIFMIAPGHQTGDIVFENIVDATFSENGSYDMVEYCEVCGEELSRETFTVRCLADLRTQSLECPVVYTVQTTPLVPVDVRLDIDRQFAFAVDPEPNTLSYENLKQEVGNENAVFLTINDGTGFYGSRELTLDFGEGHACERLDAFKLNPNTGTVKYTGFVVLDEEGIATVRNKGSDHGSVLDSYRARHEQSSYVNLVIGQSTSIYKLHDNSTSPTLYASVLSDAARLDLSEWNSLLSSSLEEETEEEPEPEAAVEPKTILLYDDRRADLAELVRFDQHHFASDAVFRFEGLDAASEESMALLLGHNEIMDAILACDSGSGESEWRFDLGNGASVSFTRESVRKLLKTARERVIYKEPEQESQQTDTVAAVLEEILQAQQQGSYYEPVQEQSITITLVFKEDTGRTAFEETPAPGPSPKKFT